MSTVLLGLLVMLLILLWSRSARRRVPGRKPGTSRYADWRAEPGGSVQFIETAVDPVCGTIMTIEAADRAMRYRGKIYYSATKECSDTFRGSPERYLVERPGKAT